MKRPRSSTSTQSRRRPDKKPCNLERNDTLCTAEESAAAVSKGKYSGDLSRAKESEGFHCAAGPNTSVEREDWDDNLPQRLYATDRFPYGRLNVYSKPDILSFIRTHFEGKPEWKTIRESCFGKLFDIQISMCPISCKLLHALLCRQLVTKQKYVLWMVYGGHPFRFSLSEFCEVTGLPGTDFVYNYKPVIGRQTRDEETAKDPAWCEVVGGSEETTLADLANLLRDNPNMPSRRKLQIAFILIVDGVLIARDQIHKPTLAYVRLVTDLDAFLAFPWGRESFVNLMESLIPTPRTPGKLPNPEDRLRVKLQQPTYIVKGFALALQLVALKSISRLTQLLDAGDVRTFMTKEFVGTTHNTTLTLDKVLEVEHGPNLYVNPIIGSVEYEWDDEVRDRKVNYMLQLIRAEHMFNKWAWPGGSVHFNKYEHKAKNIAADKPEHEKHIVARGPANKKNVVLKPKRTRKTKRSFRQNKGKMFEELLQPPPGVTTGVTTEELQEWMQQMLTAVEFIDSLGDHVGRLERQLSRRNISWFHKIRVKRFNNGKSLRTRPVKANSKVVDRPAMMEMNGDNNDDAKGSEDNTMGADRTVVNDNPIEEKNDFDQDHGDTANLIHELNNEDPLTTDNNRGEPSCPVEGNIDGEPVDRAGLDVLLNVAASNLESNKAGDYVDCGTDPKYTNDKKLGEDKEVAARPQTLQSKIDLYKVASGQESNDTLAADDKKEDLKEMDGLTDDVYGEEEELGQNTNDKESVDSETGEEELEEDDEEDEEGRVDNNGKGNENESDGELDGETSIVHLSDSSPVREHMRHKPSSLETKLATMLAKRGNTHSRTNFLPTVDPELWDLFHKTLEANKKMVHITEDRFYFTNQFLIELSESGPDKWTSSLHMEVLVHHLSIKHHKVFSEGKNMIDSPWLCNHLQGRYNDYKNPRSKRRITWQEDFKKYVCREGKRWYVDIDTLYVPMNWEGKHWVGLAIHLKRWTVDLMDPYPKLTTAGKAKTLMAPVLEMLPHIIMKFCTPQKFGLNPFMLQHYDGVYENNRTGDCGPVAIKFMEMHANGQGKEAMSQITDRGVDNFRKQYAIDIYNSMVLPLYFPHIS